MPYGRRRSAATPAHHKSMGSYHLFAWRDAMALAQLLEEMYEPSKTLELYNKLTYEDLQGFEQAYADDIATLIGRSESQRPSALRRMDKEHPEYRHSELCLLLAIIAQVRTMEVLELRDYYRTVMAAGSGNRVTCVDWYEMSRGIAKLFDEYLFPFKVFDAYGADIAWKGRDSPDDADDDSLED